MTAISRRRFLRDASLGAAAVGAVAAIGPSAFGATTAAAGASARTGAAVAEATPAGRTAPNEVMAHVVDPSSGTIAVFSGTNMVTFQDHRVANALLRAAQ
jgi:hypothetical protein